MGWIERIFRRRRLSDELAEELRLHIEEKTEQLMRLDGLSRSEAREAALRAFGNPVLVETQSTEVWQWPRLESLLADLRLALRRLRRSPGFATTVLLTLAVGIGANTAVFSVINRVLLQPLPYPEADQLVSLRLNAPGAAGLADFQNGLPLSSSMYFTFSESNRTFQSLGTWTSARANVSGVAQAEQVNVVLVTDGVLEALGVPPLAGRELTAADQAPNGAKNVVLSYGYWQRRFGGDRSVIGRAIVMDSQARTIVGVMPRGFRIVDHDFDVLAPSAFERNKQSLAGFGLQGIGRLKPGVTIAQANADIARLVPVWMDSFSNGPGSDPHWYDAWRITPDFHSLKQEVVGNVGSVLWVVMGTIGIVLLIACVNVANLLLVRAEARQLELSIRAALGAGRGRIARELLFESSLLGLLGGIMGIGVALAGLRLLVSIGPANLPRLTEITLDARSLLFAFVLSLLSGLFFGSIPAWKYTRYRGNVSLGATRTVSASRERHRSRNILIVAQVAMAVVLLVCATLMIRTFRELSAVDPGFTDAPTLQTLRIAIPESSIADPQMVARVENNIADKLASLPGVSDVGFALLVPMEDAQHGWNAIRAEGKTYAGDPPLRFYNYISPGYFQTIGTHLVAGRDITWKEIYDVAPRAIVSENLAREEWGSAANAIGKRFREAPSEPWSEVIGVAENVHYNGVNERAPAIVYWPAIIRNPWLGTFTPRSVAFVIRSKRAGTEALVNEIQQSVRSVNADLPVAAPRTMQEIYSKSLARTSFTLAMLGVAAAMALALGIIGIYGVISYSVSQRTREIGIRMALGAQKLELRWMLVRSALVLTGIGIVIGLGAAAGVARLLTTLLYGVSPLDPFSFAAVPLILFAAATLASFLPASRVAVINPVDALKAE
ncbi:ABC efflux pump, inner membrane subunit [Candidatus Koribacter versatilis Ellin345]|uniref:ABC efflux pump, inner membrane subunit n=1 Tax=Koribacter versatilis (strain Ellin345) TaxID=204669 RepID=Q1IKX8_KORVE|nr:ABC transporter permease [Candidatus Koribacter versatilis]ABF42472.1 ABC efflux pump, inner membrane subunit [Candidatus Koribacter versatilis Ellin345]